MLLTEAVVQEYFAGRLAGAMPPPGLARPLHQRTGGNPLFMADVVDYRPAQSLLLRGRALEAAGGI